MASSQGAAARGEKAAGGKANVYLKDFDPAVIDETWDRFLSALLPLAAGQLGALLFQFPQWFLIGRASKAYILCSRRAGSRLRICVEFRNKTWMSDDNHAETLDVPHRARAALRRRRHAAGVSIVRPTGGRRDLVRLAVVRFHGHSDKWDSRDIYDRFGYRYPTPN